MKEPKKVSEHAEGFKCFQTKTMAEVMAHFEAEAKHMDALQNNWRNWDVLQKSIRQILLNIRGQSPVGSPVRKQANAALLLLRPKK